MEKIGIIGLENTGSLLVKRLLINKAKMIIYDSDPNRMLPHVHLGVKPAASPADVVTNSTFIIICDTDEQKREDLFSGINGINNTIQAGNVVVDTFTSSPNRIRKIALVLEKRGADIVDASIIPGNYTVQNETLSIVVGGKEEVFKRCRPILSLLGDDVIHVGDLGSGHVVKAINMMMMGANLIAAAEILGLGVKAGLDRKKILDVINVSSGESFITSNYYLKHILTETYDFKFTLELMLKDIRVCTQIAHEMDIPALVTTRIEEIYAMACYHGMGPEDSFKIDQFIGNLMGVQS